MISQIESITHSVLILYFLVNVVVLYLNYPFSNAFRIEGRGAFGIHILDLLHRNNTFYSKNNNSEIGDDFFTEFDEKDYGIDEFAADLGIVKPKVESKVKAPERLSNKRIQELDPPLEATDEGYNCLLHLIGIPYNFTEFMIAKWLEDYGVARKDVVFLLEANGSFTGDAYVRCANNQVQRRIVKEKHMNHISERYIEIYPVREWAYWQYYQAKYFKKLTRGFYTPLEALVPLDGFYKSKSRKLTELECGDLVIGKISEITGKGAIISPLNIICESDNVIFLLCNSNLSQNVTFHGDVAGSVELKLILGMEINLYYEKIKIIDKNTDFWCGKNINSNSNININNSLNIVYLTMDCNIYNKNMR